MPYKNESMLMGGDASADTSTELCFNPPEGPFDASNVVTGTIAHATDEDWIAIKLTEGNTYTISTGGETAEGRLNDSVLKLMDSKGGLISMNDDVKPAEGMLGSAIEFTPEAGSGTQVYFISVSGYTGNPGAKNTGAYTVTVKQVAHPPAGEGVDIPGTDMDDKLTGTDDAESISGEDGNDSLFGLGGDDDLNGGAGNDLLVGGAGADKLTGGGGNDTISYMGSAMGVNINLRAGTASGGDAEGDILGEMIENVMGPDNDDTLSGGRGNNMLWGFGGNDELYGDRGDDMLFGGDGDDELDGGDGDDKLEGGYGADELTGSDGDDTASYSRSMMGVTVRLHASQAMGGDAEGDTWGDTVTVQYDNPDPEADPEDATLEETVPDIVNLTGSAMSDILAGDSRANRIEGGGGDDKLYGGPGGGDDVLHGDAGDDMIFGGIGRDTLWGGPGDDMIVGGRDADTIYGGYGSDMIYADSTDTTINGWLIQALDADTDEEIDNPGPYVGPLDDADTTDPDTTDVVVENDESTEAGSDPDAVDTVSFEKLEEGIGVSGTPWSLVDNAVNIENVIGTSENDFIVGDGGDNVIDGGDGADSLNGAESDTSSPGKVEVNGDTVSYANSDRGVNIDLDRNDDGTSDDHTASGGHAQGDTLTNFENVTGSAHDDNLDGGSGANILKGLAGDDELRGFGGSDTIEGGAGADEMDGGTDDTASDNVNGEEDDGIADTLSYASSDAGVSVNFATLTFSGGHAEGDEVEVQRDAYDPDGATGPLDPVDVSTFENILGSMHNDRLTGDHRVNVLTGGAGDDHLRGGGEADTLIGGPGADTLDGGSSLAEGAATPNDSTDDVQHVDVASYARAMAGVTVNLATGRGTAGDAEGDRLVNIEKVMGSDHDDTFIAGPKPDNIDGAGNPAMMPEGDTVSYELSDEAVTIDLGATTNSRPGDATNTAVPGLQGTQGDPDSYAAGDILLNIENVIGSPQDDNIIGTTTGANSLMGGDGDDTMAGLAGNDTLMGGDGNDMLGAVDPDGTGAETAPDESGNDKLMGGAGRDTLDGGAGSDTLIGGAGDDEMTGGEVDTDAATGGTGHDIFVFSPEDGDGDDIINGFTAAQDKIDLSAFGLDAEDLVPLISVRGGAIRIDLRSVGGGTIELAGVSDLDVLDVATGASADGTITDQATDGAIQMLSVWSDDDGNTTEDATDGNDMVDPGEGGIFIL